MAVLDT